MLVNKRCVVKIVRCFEKSGLQHLVDTGAALLISRNEFDPGEAWLSSNSTVLLILDVELVNVAHCNGAPLSGSHSKESCECCAPNE